MTLEIVAFAAVDVFLKIVEPKKSDVILAFPAVELSVNVVAPWELRMLALLALELLLNVVELPLTLETFELPAVDVSLKTIEGAVGPDPRKMGLTTVPVPAVALFEKIIDPLLELPSAA